MPLQIGERRVMFIYAFLAIQCASSPPLLPSLSSHLSLANTIDRANTSTAYAPPS